MFSTPGKSRGPLASRLWRNAFSKIRSPHNNLYCICDVRVEQDGKLLCGRRIVLRSVWRSLAEATREILSAFSKTSVQDCQTIFPVCNACRSPWSHAYRSGVSDSSENAIIAREFQAHHDLPLRLKRQYPVSGNDRLVNRVTYGFGDMEV